MDGLSLANRINLKYATEADHLVSIGDGSKRMTSLLSYSLRVVVSAFPSKSSIASTVGHLSATPKRFLGNRLKFSYRNYISAMAKPEEARIPPAVAPPSVPNGGKFKIALCQLSVTENKERNIAHARAAVEAAADNGAQLVVLPEIWNGPYSNASFPVYAEDIDAGGSASPSTSMLSEVARSKGITIVGGSISERSGDQKPKEREKVSDEQPEEADWGYCTEDQLEDLLLKHLEYVYKEAGCKITALGYTTEQAHKAMLRNGHCYGSNDVISNIVNNSLAYLNSGCSDCFDESDTPFREIKELEKYVLTGLVYLLRQVRPQLSKGDAMWCLLMSDLHVGRASTLEIPSLPSGDEKPISKPIGNGPSLSTSISMPSPIRPSCSSPSFVHVNTTSEPCRMCAETKKISGVNLAQAGTAAVDTSSSAQKGFTFDAGTSHTHSTNTTHFSPNAVLTPSMKLALLKKNAAALFSGHLLSDRKSKSDVCSQSVDSNSECLAPASGVQNIQTGSGNFSAKNHVLTGDLIHTDPAVDASSVVTAGTELSLGIASTVDVGQNQYRGETGNCQDIVGAILGSLEHMGITEKSDGIDQRNEMMLKLMHQIRDLEMQLKERIEWAHQKAMQAARKLSKDLAELKTLRTERDETLHLKKDKQALEDTTMKRLSEMENDLRKASGQVDRANSAVRKLETENAEVRAEMEASKLSAAESVATCHEIAKREKKCLKRVQTWEKQESKLRDEICDEKQKIAQLQKELSLIRDLQKEMETKCKQEEKAKEEATAQAEEERRAKDAAEASARRREEALHRKTEMNFQRHKDDIERLEQELARLKVTAESSQPNSRLNAPYAVNGANVKSLKEMNARMRHELQELQESSQREGNSDRKCVMCMSEEVSVVFLPCAHQVVCVKCNEKQGLTDCPSCTIPIQRRINVYGVSSKG